MQSTFHKDSLFTYHHSFIIHLYHDRQRERKKKIHLVLAITAMVAIALGVVGIRVGFIFSTEVGKRILMEMFPGHAFSIAIVVHQGPKNTDFPGSEKW